MICGDNLADEKEKNSCLGLILLQLGNPRSRQDAFACSSNSFDPNDTVGICVMPFLVFRSPSRPATRPGNMGIEMLEKVARLFAASSQLQPVRQFSAFTRCVWSIKDNKVVGVRHDRRGLAGVEYGVVCFGWVERT